MTNLIPKTTKLQVKSTKLTDSQREVIRCLLLGGIIYVDDREKYRMFLKETGVDHVKSGHGRNHLYRPTVLFFIEQRIVIPKKVTREEFGGYYGSELNWSTDVLVINPDYSGDFSAEIDEVKVEAVLGVDRGTTNSKKF